MKLHMIKGENLEEKPTAAFALSLIGGIFVLLGGIGIFALFTADFGAIGKISNIRNHHHRWSNYDVHST